MALDTRDKRASALACGLAFLTVLPVPDGAAFDQGDRQQASAVYRGVLAGEAVETTPSTLLLQAGYGFRTRVQAGYGFTATIQGGG